MNDEIKSDKEFILPQDLGAVAKTFFVQTEKTLQRKEEQLKEIHWYQCENIGKVEFKTKEWCEQNAGQV